MNKRTFYDAWVNMTKQEREDLMNNVAKKATEKQKEVLDAVSTTRRQDEESESRD